MSRYLALIEIDTRTGDSPTCRRVGRRVADAILENDNFVDAKIVEITDLIDGIEYAKMEPSLFGTS